MGNYYLVMLYKNKKFSEERRLNRLNFIGKNNNVAHSINKAKKYTLNKARKVRDEPENFITQHFKYVIVDENLKMVR